ncbi:HEPN domain protein [Phycisphaerae bacterium RAS1]|nr:HEPN domain protein [Phycisphaerae bacterium RAS1]
MARAHSNLIRAKVGHGVAGVLLEDLCFDLQQAAEKALKGLLVARTRGYPKTHSISELLALHERAGVHVPAALDAAIELTAYAVRTRYPGMAAVTEEEYAAALKVTEEVVSVRRWQQRNRSTHRRDADAPR